MTIKGKIHQTRSITSINVSGYKSIAKETFIEIAPLTILAGANSSGKSSFFQPILLLKQTLEASYDPGPLLLDGPNVKITSVDQMLSQTKMNKPYEYFSIGINVDKKFIKLFFKRGTNKRLILEKINTVVDNMEVTLDTNVSHDDMLKLIPDFIKTALKSTVIKKEFTMQVERERCFFNISASLAGDKILPMLVQPSSIIEPHILKIIHVPGLRGNPERNYPVTAVGSTFPGTFEPYVASVVAQWQDEDKERLKKLSADLEFLGLTWKVTALRISDTQVEIKVGRLPHAARGGAQDLVSIADVGFGVSQTLPVLVALHVAEPGQIVYLEQPEIHLHPRAQAAMANILVEAINRGVKVVVETHSSILILSIQALMAEGAIKAEKVKLHWFSRDKDGATKVSSSELDSSGSFGDWPEDFGEVTMQVESRYLDAADRRRLGE